MTENTEPWQVYCELGNQWIMGSGGPIDVNLLALESVLDRIRPTDRDWCRKQVTMLSRHVISQLNEEQKQKWEQTKQSRGSKTIRRGTW